MIAAMGGFQFIRDDEIIFEKASSKDKDYVVIEGRYTGLDRALLARRQRGNIRTR